ncbi:NAD(P)-binding protein [Coniophora puteana RWD-64-598 SS2]|uniref:NAD(P)-binding protein n=1 Tax=Coniophora puteana (strain RWD-64-598) TaxID=741705 RepID=A0A5M3N7H9_CONPW|nr:NAD(P)-binding protein [Coniophora puteana RWD-64-598 SS2]EIW87054.1 NAD(P)-binding protein [Coniophora puteana RWD-64-598 SS2]
MSQRIVICGAGFVGSHIAKVLLSASTGLSRNKTPHIQISSRAPDKVHSSLARNIEDSHRLLPPCKADVTDPSSLAKAFEDADVVVSLVGTMSSKPDVAEKLQWHGAENVAKAAENANAKLIHFSAIGADETSKVAYSRTKALGEKAVLAASPTATIIRPSIVFGPGDAFFNRFAQMSRFLPFMPVFGGGKTRFQPVYVGDIGRAVELLSRNDPEVEKDVSGKIIEAGGPEVFTYEEIMRLVLHYTGRRRPILSLPFGVGKLQAAVLEKLPENLFTLTQDQVEQLKIDNIVNPNPLSEHMSFEDILQKHASCPLTSVHSILPTYLSDN